MAIESDGTIILRSLQDPSAFMQIFERHVREIGRFLRRRVDQTTADDLTSEVFVVAFRARRRYREGSHDARPWLYGIASNLVRNHARSERAALTAVSRLNAEPAHREAEPLSILLERTLEPFVAEALLRLTPADREVLLLFAWGDLSYGEIASALSTPVGTVRSRLNRARRTVRSHLESSVGTAPQEACNG
jgi:RNA polymerase sigma factor (sigma-70 family)